MHKHLTRQGLNPSCSLGLQYVFLVEVSVSLVFPHLGLSGYFFLIAPLPDHCLLLPFHSLKMVSGLIDNGFNQLCTSI